MAFGTGTHETTSLCMKLMEKYLGDRPEEKKILDVGCGSGFFSILLARLGHEVTGTDLTPEMIVNSKQLAREENVSCLRS